MSSLPLARVAERGSRTGTPVERGGGRRSGGEEQEGGHHGGIRGRRLYSAGIRADLHDHHAQHSPGIRRLAQRTGN
jgi:hypothetical protein